MSSSTNIQHIGVGKILETRALAVPINQRSYSWTDRQIDDLWNDLKWAISENETEYFLGTIVLTLPKDSRPLVVDGQQRLATISMLYAAIRDYLIDLGEHEIANDIQRFLTHVDRWSRIQTAKLELSAQDSLFFDHHVLSVPGSDDRKNSKITKATPDSHKRIAKGFKKLKAELFELLKGAPDPLKILGRWDNFLQDSAKLIVLEVDDESTAFQIFETLNDRGLDLAVTDLLTNYLFGKAGKSNLNAVRHNWTMAVSRIGDHDERIFKRFIHHFWSSVNGLTRERLLYKRIKEAIQSPKRTLTFSADLANSATSYAAILNSDSDLWSATGTAGRQAISTLQDLKLEQYKPLLLACMECLDPSKPAELTKVLLALVSWSVRFRVTQQLGSSKLEDFYGNGGKLVRESKFQTAKEIIDALKGKVPSDGIFTKAFEDFKEENPRLARYYLSQLEYTARRKAGIKDLINSDEQINNLEHVLPKEPDYNKWPRFTTDSAPAYVYRLGNQTLMSRIDNQKLGNTGFKAKKPVFATSDILLTLEVEKAIDWDENAIEQHQKWLASLAVETWPTTGKKN